MTTVLHLIDALDFSGSARQLSLLAPALAQRDCQVEVCCLGEVGPGRASLERAGVRVHALNWTRWFDPGALWGLRRLVRQAQPSLLHVWRLPALRALGVVARDLLGRVVLSAPLPERGRLAWGDRWLLRQVRCLALAGENDLQLCDRLGLADARRQVVPAAVAEATSADAADGWQRRYPRRVAFVGKFEAGSGAREAVWAMDILNCVFPDLHLLLVGSGPQRAALEEMAAGLRNANIHFLGDRADVASVLGAADVVWVPSRTNRGRQAALEALALGRAVVASDVPCLRDVIQHEQTGYLVAPGDVVELARRTRTLLRDAELRARLGSAGRAAVREQFSLARVTSLWHSLYNGLAA